MTAWVANAENLGKTLGTGVAPELFHYASWRHVHNEWKAHLYYQPTIPLVSYADGSTMEIYGTICNCETYPKTVLLPMSRFIRTIKRLEH